MNLVYALDDPNDKWLAPDKLDHLVYGFFMGRAFKLLGLAWGWITVPPFAVETIEAVRYYRFMHKLQPNGLEPFPWLTDKWSLKDFAVGIVGGALGFLL